MRIIDIFLVPFVYPAALLLKSIRRMGVHQLSLCKKALLQVGAFPIRDHYYEPLFDARHIARPLSESRYLPGIDWNIEGQLEVLNSFHFNEELNDVPITKNELSFYINNKTFESGDAEYWYNFIRLKKPTRIIEIGDGNSTLMTVNAIKQNDKEIPNYKCEHICIEPYENFWLEKLNISVIRQKIEKVNKFVFDKLSENDILFIDSSHIIRPQGGASKKAPNYPDSFPGFWPS